MDVELMTPARATVLEIPSVWVRRSMLSSLPSAFLGHLYWYVVSPRGTPADCQNLWDCGGQNAFTDNYLTTQKDTIFANVAVLIYVFDITSTEWESDLRYFEDILGSLRDNSSDAGVWILINKMDLADKEDPARKKFAEKKAEITAINDKVSKEKDRKGQIRIFGTTIWDESLYKVIYTWR
jgi:hypothetical protein